jgi:RES domain-containing protein
MATDKGAAVPPPADLHRRSLRLKKLAPKRWWRIHRAASKPCYFSPDPANRFSRVGLGVLYLADRPLTAFWEIFWDDLATRPPAERRIARAKLDERRVTPCTPKRTLAVFDATDAKELRTVSASTATFSGDYGNCQAWAAELAAHPQKPEGILYPSARTLGSKCVAAFESATLDCRAVAFGHGTLISKSAEILAGLADDHVDVINEEID